MLPIEAAMSNRLDVPWCEEIVMGREPVCVPPP